MWWVQWKTGQWRELWIGKMDVQLDGNAHNERSDGWTDIRKDRYPDGWMVVMDKQVNPGSKAPGANMGPSWGQQDPDGPHVGPLNFAIWVDTWITRQVYFKATFINKCNLHICHTTMHTHGYWHSFLHIMYWNMSTPSVSKVFIKNTKVHLSVWNMECFF